MPMRTKWKQALFLVSILVLGYLPVLYATATWWPHDRWSRLLSGPVSVVAGAALVGAAATRFSKWWLLALVAPLFGLIFLLTEGV